MIRVLVTGAAGSIGGAFCDFAAERHPEIVTERLSLRGEAWQKTDFSLYDAVYHCAGIVSANDKELLYEVNCRKALQLARRARECGVKQFIYLSSMAVYGARPSVAPLGGLVDQETRPQPTEDYGKSKLAGENAVRQLAGKGFIVSIIRAPSIYGRGTEVYLENYRRLLRLRVLPDAFGDCGRGSLYVDNLSELVTLLIQSGRGGIFCPQNKTVLPTVGYAKLIAEREKKSVFFSRFAGPVMQRFFSKNRLVNAVYGRICYSGGLSDIFDYRYCVVDTEESIRLALKE